MGMSIADAIDNDVYSFSANSVECAEFAVFYDKCEIGNNNNNVSTIAIRRRKKNELLRPVFIDGIDVANL